MFVLIKDVYLDLKNSKLLFMTFLDVLEKYLRPGSYKFCYADTDSFMLALTEKTIFECVKTGLKNEWNEKIVPLWFVDKNNVATEKEPGLLKPEATIHSGWFIAPSPKCYIMVEKPPCELEAQICDPKNEDKILDLLDEEKASYVVKKKSSKGCKESVSLW